MKECFGNSEEWAHVDSPEEEYVDNVEEEEHIDAAEA